MASVPQHMNFAALERCSQTYETYISHLNTTWTPCRRMFAGAAEFQAAPGRLPFPLQRTASWRRRRQAFATAVCSRFSEPQLRVPWRGDETQLRRGTIFLCDHNWRFGLAHRIDGASARAAAEVIARNARSTKRTLPKVLRAT